ncbi:MAG TPA: ABC transporter ATP-binding protein, partial [Victivallales bacterium]|nr:ABC transporter ATP-binding protein [Victivallales bacterium]
MGKAENFCKPMESVVEMNGLVKSYKVGGSYLPILKGIDISIKEGEFVGIMGPSGSGKSTLLNILGLLDVPSSGSYKLKEREVSGLSDDELAEFRNSYIGFIFQSFNLFPHLTVRQNIEVPLVYAGIPRSDRLRICAEKAAEVRLEHRLEHRPTQLSGGECQRVAIARALSNSPSFLLADEPTGNLDEKTGKEIMDLFRNLHKNRKTTIIMVTHNPEL